MAGKARRRCRRADTVPLRHLLSADCVAQAVAGAPARSDGEVVVPRRFRIGQANLATVEIGDRVAPLLVHVVLVVSVDGLEGVEAART